MQDTVGRMLSPEKEASKGQRHTIHDDRMEKLPSEQTEELSQSSLKDRTQQNWEDKQNVAMKQSGKEGFFYGNTGRRRLLTLEKTKKFFQTFKPFLGTRKGVKGSDINLKVDGKIISNQKTVAEILANHFATIPRNIGHVSVRDSSKSDSNNHPSVLQIQLANRLDLMIKSNPVNQVQVRSALESFHAGKKHLGAEKRAKPLANLYNSCISNRQWPSYWKKGKWTPVLKKEDPQDGGSYRPITVLPVVNEVFEQLLSDQNSKK